MSRLVRTAALAAALLCPAGLARAQDPQARSKPIDLVLCLDVSGSMNGLIDSAKIKLWDVVNELAKMKPTPNLRVALYSYGHATYSKDAGWVRKDLDLTTDLDEVYKQLNALRTNGGEEYVARVTRAALTELKWTADPAALKLVFVCGNEPATQDKQYTTDEVALMAKKQGVVVNTIYCGPANHPEVPAWKAFAEMAGGKYANIDQNKAGRQIAIATPFDKDILALNTKLNDTYVCYGKDAKEAQKQQVANDVAAEKAAAGAALARAESKANALYTCATWDLVDRMKSDPKFDLATIKEEDLPEDVKKLKKEERLPYLKKKAEERADLQKKINELSAKRQKHIDEELKKLPKTEGEKALDDALKSSLREQAAAKGFDVPKDGKK